MKTIKTVLLSCCLLCAGNVFAEDFMNLPVDSLKSKLLKELRNNKLRYLIQEKTSKNIDAILDNGRRYKSDELGIDEIFIQQDTLFFVLNKCTGFVNQYKIYYKFGAKTIAYPIAYFIQNARREYSRHDYEKLLSIGAFGTIEQDIYSDDKDKTNYISRIYNLLLALRYGPDFEKFKANLEAGKGQIKSAALTEEERRLVVQANMANNEKQYEKALQLYEQAMTVNAFSFPQAYYNMALIAAEMQNYVGAIINMKKYLLLVPDAPDARAAQDKIYEWEYKLNK